MTARLAALVFGALLAIGPGCRTTTAPILGAGPFDRIDGSVLDDALTAARAAGYRPVALDAGSGRFELVARSDSRGHTRFVVQCFADGYVSVVPIGPTVVRDGDRISLPGRLRAEYAALAIALDEALTVTR